MIIITLFSLRPFRSLVLSLDSGTLPQTILLKLLSSILHSSFRTVLVILRIGYSFSLCVSIIIFKESKTVSTSSFVQIITHAASTLNDSNSIVSQLIKLTIDAYVQSHAHTKLVHNFECIFFLFIRLLQHDKNGLQQMTIDYLFYSPATIIKYCKCLRISVFQK